MGFLKQLNALIWAWSETLRAVRHGVAVLPFAMYAAVQCAVLFAVVGFAYAPLSIVVAPALRWRFGEAALHYPSNLVALRPALAQVDSVLIVLLGAVLTATAVHSFGTYFAGRKRSFIDSWRAAVSRYLPLVVVSAIVMVVTHFTARAPFSFLSGLAESSPGVFRIVRFGAVAVVIVVQSLFVYTTPGLVISRTGLREAIVRSFRLAVTTPFTSLLIVGVPAAFELLPLWLSRQSARLAMTLAPEVLIWMMLLWVIVILVAAYATAAAATRLFLFSIQDDEAADEGRGA